MRISDWSSDVCSSDLRRGPRAATGASDGPVEATVSGSHGGRRAERAEENGKSRPHGKPVLMGAAGAISPPHPRPWRRERKVDETNQVATAAAAAEVRNRSGARTMLWILLLVYIFNFLDRKRVV